MTAPPTVPLTVTLEAAALIAELEMEAEFEQMVEHTRRTVPFLRRIEVVLDLPCDMGDDPRVTIEAWRREPLPADDATQREWGDWLVETFPPDVFRYFGMMLIDELADAS
jgi:hypothetical protein